MEKIMKTLIINGSPRKKGDTITLINEMVKHLDGEVKIIHTYYDDISPCVDCRYCWKQDACSIQDDMQEIYQLLNEVDNVIIASPIYFSELTGKLLSFASRLQRFFVQRVIRNIEGYKLKDKKGVFIIVGGGDGSPEPAIERATIIFHQINTESIGIVKSLGTNHIPVKDDKEALTKARVLALKLNQLYQSNENDVI